LRALKRRDRVIPGSENYEVEKGLHRNGISRVGPRLHRTFKQADDAGRHASTQATMTCSRSYQTQDRVLAEPGNPQGLSAGLIAVNSEVGARKLILMRFFLYREMCGNHIIWGAQEHPCLASHGCNSRGRFAPGQDEIKRYTWIRVGSQRGSIAQATRTSIAGGTKEEVLEAMFGFKGQAQPDEAGHSKGPSRLQETQTQTATHGHFTGDSLRACAGILHRRRGADERTAIDSAAGKILRMAF